MSPEQMRREQCEQFIRDVLPLMVHTTPTPRVFRPPFDVTSAKSTGNANEFVFTHGKATGIEFKVLKQRKSDCASNPIYYISP